MFKKQFKVQNSHAVAGKDKKKLAKDLVKLGYDPQCIEAFLDDKQYDNQELSQDKIQGSKVVVLSRNKTPLMFTGDAKTGIYYPSIYLLFQLEKLPTLRVYLKTGVESYIFNGADLMWPGVKAVQPEEFRQYDFAVIYAKNQVGGENSYVPVAVGKILANKVPKDPIGKAVQVEHYLYDELWNTGPKKIPEELKVSSKDENANTEEIKQNEESKDDQIVANGDGQKTDQEEEKKQEPSLNPDNLQEESKFLTQQDEEEEEKIPSSEEQKISSEEMDPRIIEAFYRSLMETVKDSDLPLEPSDYFKDHLALYQAQEFRLDLRMSSFKRIGKLLEVMHKKGIIEYSEPKGVNHKLITKINRSNEEFKSYVPQYSLRHLKKAQNTGPTNQDQSGVNYPKVQIDELFTLSKHLNAIFGNIKDIELKQYYNGKETRDYLSLYIKQNNLDSQKKGFVKLDPILAQIIPREMINSSSEVHKDQLFKSLQNNLSDSYSVTILDESEIRKDRQKFHRGQVPKVLLKAQRVANKKQTTVEGLELFQIDYEELLPYLSQKCSCSVTTNESENKQKQGLKILIQGSQLDAVEEILTKRYKVPQKYIEKVNTIQSKGKKGKK